MSGSTVACPGVARFVVGAESRCANCHRPAIRLDGVEQHKRGRWRDALGEAGDHPSVAWLAALAQLEARVAEANEWSRAYAARLRATETDDTICDCGLPLEGHPPLPKVARWGGWTSQRTFDEPWRNTMSGKPLSAAVQRKRREARERMAGFSERHPGASPGLMMTRRRHRAAHDRDFAP